MSVRPLSIVALEAAAVAGGILAAVLIVFAALGRLERRRGPPR